MATPTVTYSGKATPYSWIGIIVTFLLVVGGIFLLYKHRKSPGFWWGFGSMFLIASYLVVNSDGFKLGAGFLRFSYENNNTKATDPVFKG